DFHVYMCSLFYADAVSCHQPSIMACVLTFSLITLALLFFFFFNDTATTEIYTLSLHDALPICQPITSGPAHHARERVHAGGAARSEEHTSELQSRSDLVCRLLLEKKKK